MSTKRFSKIWEPHVVDNTSLTGINLHLLLMSVNHVTIGSNTRPQVSVVFANKSIVITIDKKNIECFRTGILYYPLEIKNAQELLLNWVQYQCKIDEKFYADEFAPFSTVKLMQEYLVFKSSAGFGKVVNLNSVKEIVRINFGEVNVTKPSGSSNKYVMKFIVTSTNNVESEVLIVSDTAIKSPSHAKITELTEEQYNKIARDKIFKTF